MRLFSYSVVCLIAFSAGSLRAGEKSLPPDLALVPPDGLLFLHVRVQDVYKSDHFKEWRETLKMAGDKALAAFDSRFFPAPSSLDRVTVFLPKNAFEPIVVISTSKAIDRAAFLKFTIPEATEEKGAFGTLYRYPRKNLGFFFANENTLVVGPPNAVRDFLEAPKAKKGNLSDPLKLANSGNAAVLAVNLEAIPEPLRDVALQQAPPPMRAILEPASKARLVTATVDLRKEGRLDVQFLFADAKLTADGEDAATKGIKIARDFIGQKRDELKKRVNNSGPDIERLPEAALNAFSLGMLNRFDDYLASGPIKKNGNTLALSVPIPRDSQAALLASAASLGFLQSMRYPVYNTPKVVAMAPRPPMTRDQVMSSNNLKQIVLAMHTYHDANKTLPAAAICDKNGKPLLSWRVAILPYIEQAGLYEEFKLDEPWDSAHNKKLIERMPAIYKLPAKTKTPAGETHYLVFVGSKEDAAAATAFDLKDGVGLTQFTDGTSNTILCLEASKSVPWTKPEDIPYDAKKPLPKPADFYGSGTFLVAAADGSVHVLRINIPEAKMRALITRNGGEVESFDD